MSRRILVSTVLVSILLSSSCRKAASRSAVQTDVAQGEVSSPKKRSSPAASQGQARMVIQTANLSLVVTNSAAALQKITTAVQAKGGYLADMRQWRELDQLRATATLRIPAHELYPVLVDIRKSAVRIESETLSGQDVSEEYSDLGAQLINMEATEKELRELLTTIRLRSQKASEVLEIYGELTKVRGEIERMRGRMRYLDQMTTLSTITVDLTPDVLARPVVEPGWRPLVSVRNAGRALVATVKTLTEGLIWVGIYVLPVALVLLILVFVARFSFRRMRRFMAKVEAL
ncbi:MAG TPA: DUF4349 domain-containing protein [Thermoanaerobaculia bacterium]|nr:DUF4349 domain-containing protein [Thermoanaerobaculia bacterium]